MIKASPDPVDPWKNCCAGELRYIAAYKLKIISTRKILHLIIVPSDLKVVYIKTDVKNKHCGD